MNHFHPAVPPAVPETNAARRRGFVQGTRPNDALSAPTNEDQQQHQQHQQQQRPSVKVTPPPPPPPPPQKPVAAHRPPPFQLFPLPWYSAPGQPFPGRQRPRRRRQAPPPKPPPAAAAPSSVTAPTSATEEEIKDTPCTSANSVAASIPSVEETKGASCASSSSTTTTTTTTNPVAALISAPDESKETPCASTNPPSEAGSTRPSTPASAAPSLTANVKISKPSPAIPFVPAPAVPIITPKLPKVTDPKDRRSSTASTGTVEAVATGTVPAIAPQPPAPPAPPKSWADLVKTPDPSKPTTNGSLTGVVKANGAPVKKAGSLGEALKTFRAASAGANSTPFLEPRGLINTGNMCFMNSVLQMLVFCGPFYLFLDGIGKQIAHNFKSETPLIDAMIMFLREFRTIKSAASASQISALKERDLEAFGEPFVPEYVYEVMRNLKSFAHMRRGHQQDAEEFLGFLLDGLHEEAVKVQNKENTNDPDQTDVLVSEGETDDGWMEVGHRQKTTTTRTTEIMESPITRIFGGKLRSEFRVPGLHDSVTLEPYTPLQLDIQGAEVRSVVDALKNLTKLEHITGDFKSPKGPDVTAKKQVFIDTLPPVLILHLKRFQYDNTGGTQKIWKRIGYPLELEIPRESMSPTNRNGPPAKYRLIGVVYHHGKSASGGHYTVDVLRQDAKNWIRIDDTVIRRVRSDDVAVDVKDLAPNNNADGEEQDGWVNGWEEVNGNGNSNGGTPPKKERYVGKDNKVAYILFYQKLA